MEDSHTSKDCDYSGLGIQGRMNKITNFCHFSSLESNRRDRHLIRKNIWWLQTFNKKNIWWLLVVGMLRISQYSIMEMKSNGGEWKDASTKALFKLESEGWKGRSHVKIWKVILSGRKSSMDKGLKTRGRAYSKVFKEVEQNGWTRQRGEVSLERKAELCQS